MSETARERLEKAVTFFEDCGPKTLWVVNRKGASMGLNIADIRSILTTSPEPPSVEEIAGLDALPNEGWRPVSDAGVGTTALVTDGKSMAVMRLSDDFRDLGEKHWVDTEGAVTMAPTYWQPLPSPPPGGSEP